MRWFTFILLLVIGCPSVDPETCPCREEGSECNEETNLCEMISPDGGAADSATDVVVLDAQVPDVIIPDAIVPDAELVDGSLNVPDAIVPDAIIPDALIPDALVPDAMLPDMDVPDINIPDMMIPTCPPGALLCDGFEDSLADHWEVYETTGAMAVIDDTRSRAGQKSVRIDTGPGRLVELRYEHATPLVAGELHVRMHLFVPEGVNQRFAFLTHKEGSSPWQGMTASINDDRLAVNAYREGVSLGFQPAPASSFPNAQWVCVTVATTIGNNAPHTATAGGERVSITTDTLPATGIGTTIIGVVLAQNQPGFSFWIDDVTIDRQALPCP